MRIHSLWLLLLLLLAGCCDDASQEVFVHSGPGLPGASPSQSLPGTIVYRVAAPSSVQEVQFVGYNALGAVSYGPVSRPAASETRLTDVPPSTVALLTVFRGASTAVGLDGHRFVLPPGATVVLEGEFRPLEGLATLSVEPVQATLAVGGELQLQAVVRLADRFSFPVTELVQWSSGTSAVATVSPAGVARGVSPGQSVATASYGSLSASSQLTVTGKTLIRLQVEPPQLNLSVGSESRLAAVGFYDDGSSQDLTQQVAWSSSNSAVAEVSNAPPIQGHVTGRAAGTATITAVDSSSGLRGSAAVTVRGSGTGSTTGGSVTTTGGTGTTTGGTGTTTGGTGTATGGTGTATGGSTGGTGTTTGGTATTTGGTTGGSTGGEVSLIRLEVSPERATVAAGRALQMRAIGIYSDSTTEDLTDSAEWSSSRTQVAVVEKGLATGLAPGDTFITARFGGVQGQQKLTVTAAELTAIEVSPQQLQLAAGTSQQLTGTGIYSDGSRADLTNQLTWQSDAAQVASVGDAAGVEAPGDKGLVEALRAGQATISATDPLTGLKGTARVTVTAAQLQRLEVSPNPGGVLVLARLPMHATGIYSDGTRQDLTDQATWTSSEPDIAFIFNLRPARGVLLGLRAGTTFVQARVGGLTGTAKVDTLGGLGAHLEVTPPLASIPVDLEQAFQATVVLTGDRRLDVTSLATWSSSAPEVAVVSNDQRGLALGVSAGQASISASLPGVGLSGQATLTVTAPAVPTLIIEPREPRVTVGSDVPFQAFAQLEQQVVDVTQDVTWASSDQNVAEISNAAGSQGLARTHAAGASQITATLNTGGTLVRTSTTLIVTAAPVVSVQVLPANPSLAVNATLELTAQARDSQGATYDLTRDAVWTSSNPSILTVATDSASAGLATGIAPGTVTVTARDPVSGVSGATNVTVLAPTPPVTPAHFSAAALVQTAVLDGNSKTDSYNSASGPYNPSTARSQGHLTTGGITPGLVQLLGSSTVRGTTYVGPGGKVGPPAPTTPTLNSDLVVWKDWNCSSLAEKNLHTVPTQPAVVVPPVTGPDTDLNIGFAGGAPAPGRYGSITVGGGGTMTLAAGTYVVRDLTVSGGGTIAVPQGVCNLFITGTLSLTSGPIGPPQPGRLAIQLASGSTASLSQGVRASLTLYGPAVPVTMSGDAQLSGAVSCKALNMTGGSAIHFDEALLSL